MKLFSKRNSNRSRLDDDFRYSHRLSRYNQELISSEVRNRIVAEIKFLTSSDDFIEFFILFENKKKETIFFDRNKVDNFSLSELGYKMTDYFDFEDFTIKQQERKVQNIDNKDRIVTYFDDYKLFDLCEIVILFSTEQKRSEIIGRFNTIFLEENADFQIVEHLITRKSGETLKTLVALLKDDNLKNKIRKYFDLVDEDDYINSAKISADILNIIFSGYIKNNKLQDISVIKNKLAQKILRNTAKKEEKSIRFLQYIDELLKTSRNLSNDIYDVRHTEKSTIQTTNENIYKLISHHNMSIVELVLTALKEDYILGDNWEKIKCDYLQKYKIDKGIRYVIENPKVSESDDYIDVKDIPF
jgi:hypothetical protein